MVGTFARLSLGGMLLILSAFPIVNLVTFPLAIWCLVSGVRRIWRAGAPGDDGIR